MYSWEAIKAGAAGYHRRTRSGIVIDPTGESGILDVTAPDDHTVVVTFASVGMHRPQLRRCLLPLPSQSLPTDVDPVDRLRTATSTRRSPAVPSTSANSAPASRSAWSATPTYADALDGVVKPAGYIYKNVPDATVLVEQFLAGETNLIDNPSVPRRADIRASDCSGLQLPRQPWDYLGVQPGRPEQPAERLRRQRQPD